MQHILTCPIYERQRRDNDVLRALNDTPGHVLDFLKRIGHTAAPDLEKWTAIITDVPKHRLLSYWTIS